jgi:biotin-dependent carboxylase-like uncharacterized protein
VIELVKISGACSIQDLGRPGRMHEGLAPGGALVRALLVRANRAAGNDDGAAALEISGRIVVRAAVPVVLGLDDGPHELAAGEELAIASEPRRVAYVAVAGGVDAPVVLGSRSTQLSAGIGALLRAGNVLGIGVERLAAGPRAGEPFFDAGPIRIIPGPDLDAFEPGALEALCAAAYRISPQSDRVGTRLDGPPLARRDVPDRSSPMVRGAIEVPRDGLPIVLGPEHPTTGGYPLIAVVAAADLDRFHAIRLGGSVRFIR